MIRPDTAQWFLKREIPNNFDWVKSLPEYELDTRLATFGARYHTKPFKHQKAMQLLCLEQENMLLFADMGTGKSKSILDTIQTRKQLGQVSKSLIVVPDLVNIGNWIEQVQLHRPELTALKIHGTKEERKLLLLQHADLYIINYAGLHAVLSTPDPARPRARRIFPDTVRQFAKQFQLMALDESVAIKNSASITFKICAVLSECIKYRYGMTGTPFGRQPLDLWSQFFVIDRGETLGKNIYIFRGSFFSARKTHFAIEWKLKRELEPQLNILLKNRSIRYRSEECSDLPAKVPVQLKHQLSVEAAEYYNKIKGDLEKTKQDHEWASSLKAHFIKLRQICSGFLLYKPEFAEINQEIDFGSEKLETLRYLVNTLPDDCKMIIFHEYTPSGRRIDELLTEMKVNHVWLWGGTKDKLATIQSFQQEKHIKVLVANSHSGAVGLNLQVANYVVFYESPVSPIVRAQAERRCLRTGQTKPVYIYDLLVAKSVEERILDFIKEGESLWEAVLHGKVRLVDLLTDL